MSWRDCALLRAMGSHQPCARGTLRAGNARSAVSDLDSGTRSHGILGAAGHREAHQGLTPTPRHKDVPPRSPAGPVSGTAPFPASLQNKHGQQLTAPSKGCARLAGAQQASKRDQPGESLLSYHVPREETRQNKPRDLLGGVIPTARVGKG